MNRSESITNLGKALVKAQTQMTTVKKDSVNPHFKSSYASLAAVNEAVLPYLSANGIAVLQGVSSTQDVKFVGVSTTFIHGDSGEWWTEELLLSPTKNDPQGFGSAITYGRRYLLMAMAGIAADDDDANDASSSSTKTKPQSPAIKPTLPVPQPVAKPAISDNSRKRLHALGTEMYGDAWESKRHDIVLAVTKERTNSSNDLFEDEAQTIIAGMEAKKKELVKKAA